MSSQLPALALICTFSCGHLGNKPSNQNSDVAYILFKKNRETNQKVQCDLGGQVIGGTELFALNYGTNIDFLHPIPFNV